MQMKILAPLAVLAGLFFATASGADDIAPADTEARIDQLEQELRLLRRQIEVDRELAQANADKLAKAELGAKGLFVSAPDRNLTIGLRGYAQLDSRFFLNDDAKSANDGFLARRIRPILEGTAFRDFSFRLMPDFAGNSTRILDAHVDYRLTDALRFRAGKFKPPVGLERLQSATDTFFIERGLPTNLVPTRDFGFQVYGDLIPESLEYQLGIFNGVGDLGNGDADDDDRKDIVARLFAHPFRRSDVLLLQGFGIGIGGSFGEREGSPLRASLRPILGDYRSPGQQVIFRYRQGSSAHDDPTFAADTVFADGRHVRIAPQAYWYYNQFGLLAEYTRSSQEVTRGASSTTLDHDAWQIAASWVLSGEDLAFRGGIRPGSRFDPHQGSWGALQLVARVGVLDLDDASFPIYADPARSVTRAESAGIGLNWYLNQNVELWLDYDYTRFDGGAADGADREDEQALFTRFQFRF
jgi:phosphate-selective porin OprO/OprP